MRRILVLGLLVAACAWVQPALAVSGAGYTTVNTAVDGTGHCKNGNPGVNCNIYTDKEAVWLNGGPAANGLGPDGQYFFAVLAPGGQPDPNDGGAKNLSDDYDTYVNRTFTITNGEVSAYSGTHTFDSGSGGGVHPNGSPPFIRLFPYADTTNPGGVYIMAICSLGAGYPVVPKSCKYDAYKVQNGKGKVQAVLSGMKYLDANENGRFDAGEQGLQDWTISITGSDGTSTTVKTGADGLWSYTTGAHFPEPGSTTYTVAEVQQAGWLETGNTVDQSMTAGGAISSLASFVYTVTVPNDAVAAAEELDFGNVHPNGPVCTAPVFATDALGRSYTEVSVQADAGLDFFTFLDTTNVDVTIDPDPFHGTTAPVTVRGTQIDPTTGFGLTFDAYDLAGNVVRCDPVIGSVVRESGASAWTAFPGVADIDRYVTVFNGTPGVNAVEVSVNGQTFRLNGLRGGETRTIDISSAIVAGATNEVFAITRGAPGGTATVMISN